MKKIIAILLLILIAISLSSSSNTASISVLSGTKPPKFDRDLVALIRCGSHLGTGIPVSSNVMTTAAHVPASEKVCSTTTRRMNTDITTVYTVTSQDFVLDFAAMQTHKKQRIFPVLCQPLITGETYWLVGYPGGSNALEINPAIALDTYQNSYDPAIKGSWYSHQRQLRGKAYPGMSGGPVFDKNGNVVGFLSGVSLANNGIVTIKEFIDTPLCSRSDK